MGGEIEEYCICRTSDVSRFMIGCDHCEEWYHGDCVKVTEREAKYIKRYYCRMCRQKNSKLEIVYKSKHKEKEDHHKESRKKEHHKHKKHKKERRRSKEGEGKKAISPRKIRQLGSSSDGDEETQPQKKTAEEPSKSLLKPKSQRPSVDDTSRPAAAVSASPKQSSKPSKEPSRKAGSHEQGPPAKKRKRSQDDTSEDEDFDASKLDDNEGTSDDDDGASDDWRPTAEVVPAPKPQSSKTKKEPSKKRPLPSSGRTGGGGGGSSSRTATNAAAGGGGKKRRHWRANAGSSSSDEADAGAGGGCPLAHVDDTRPRQCHGQKCVNSCRPGSNYCSDSCGIKLASLRIMQTLPDRIREWNLTPCEAEARNRKDLEKVHAKQDRVKARLEQLNRDFRDLEDLISRGKAHTIDQDKEDEEEEGESAETYVHCVTCGSDIQTRTAIRHMERCYNKFESQTSFASKFKTMIDDERLFCDYFNPKDQTFCKRLQVLCPEHNKDQLAEDEVCGYPIQKQVFGNPVEFCRLSQKKCQQHSFWEKLRRAEIDMERVRNWMKADELMEQERVVKATMSGRAGVLGLLLHSSINHDVEAKIQAQRAAAAAAVAQKTAHLQRKMQHPK